MVATALKYDQYIDANPIKYYQFDWIPRHITSRKDISPALKLIMSVLYGALGQDCKLMFKERTLANKTGMSVATIKRAIKKGRELRLFITIETGRGLIFKLIRQVAQNDPSLIIEKRNTVKETTTSPLSEQPPEQPPKKPPEPIPDKAPVGAVDVVSDIRKILPNEISFRVDNQTVLKKCIGKSTKHIKWASDLAMKNGRKNKVGYFIKLMEVDMRDQLPDEKRLEPVPIPKNADPLSDEIRIIVCYNRNTTGKGCTVMQGTGLMTENCKKYCPYAKGI